MSLFLAATTTLVNRAASVAVRTTVPRTLVALQQTIRPPPRFFASTVVEHVPPEDYQNGHLITDHLEYLDDMISKTLEIEEKMERLKETYAEKRQAFHQAASPEEMEALFLKAEAQKDAISQEMGKLRRSLIHRKIFAVDAPDGTSDELEQLYLEESQNIINGSARQKTA